MAALAALAALLKPRASITTVPRFCTVGINSLSTQLWSGRMSRTLLPRISACDRSGYCVQEWLPHTTIFLMLPMGWESLRATCAIARLWSSRIIELIFFGLRSGALCMTISALVLAGLPTTKILTCGAANALRILPCSAKIPALISISSLRSMPLLRGRAPTSRTISASRKATLGSSVMITCCNMGNTQSSNSIAMPRNACCAWGMSSSCRMMGCSCFSISPLAMRNNRL